MKRVRTQMTTILLGVALTWSTPSTHAGDVRSFLSVSEWSATFTLVREYQELLDSGVTHSVTDHRWHASGTLALAWPADGTHAPHAWSGEGPVEVEVDHEVVTIAMQPGGGGVKTRIVEQGQDMTHGNLTLFIDPEGATYDVRVGAAAFDVEVHREDSMLMPGAEEGIPVRSETRTRHAHNFGASARDIPLPGGGLLLSGSTETEAGVQLQWSIEPVAQ